MKKLFAVLLTLLLVFSLPLFAMAEEVTTAPETVEETVSAETESSAVNEDESETESETDIQNGCFFF